MRACEQDVVRARTRTTKLLKVDSIICTLPEQTTKS